MLGPFAFSSARFALRPHKPDFITTFGNRQLLSGLAVEAGLLAAFLLYLRWRGWNFKIRITWKGTFLAPLLAFAAGLAQVPIVASFQALLTWLRPAPGSFLGSFAIQPPHIPRHSIDLNWAVVVFFCIVNAYYEEIVFMGYAFNQFTARRGTLFAMMAMTALRMLLHTYKGPTLMLGIGAFAIVYGLAYLSRRRLWPLIFGHTLTDLAALSVVKIFFGK